MKLEHSLTLYTKINSKWIKHPAIRPDAINLLEENIGQALSGINDTNIFSCVVGHPYVFFGELSVENFCPFFDGVVCFFGIELQKVFINIGD